MSRQKDQKLLEFVSNSVPGMPAGAPSPEQAPDVLALADAWDTATIFCCLEADPVFKRFIRMLKKPTPKRAARFVRALYAACFIDWTEYLLDLVVTSDNCLIQTMLSGADDETLLTLFIAARRELALLQDMARVTPELLGFENPSLAWNVYVEENFEGYFFGHLLNLSHEGFGVFANTLAFRVKEKKGAPTLVPVFMSDPVSFDDLFGYERQHKAVINNTRHLLQGLPAANVLLYGDAGTGKSATVKATVNLLADDGLRLVEMSKNQLHLLPDLLVELSQNPLCFVIFIDDLSFSDSDDDFAALKAVLEGGVSVRAANTVIYATSNRRHIVRETFSAREGDDIHRGDTMQETISLSERFGLRVSFDKPTKAEYLAIVRGLAAEAGLEMEDQALVLEAERFALGRAGRSARAAKQLVDALISAQLQTDELGE